MVCNFSFCHLHLYTFKKDLLLLLLICMNILPVCRCVNVFSALSPKEGIEFPGTGATD